VPAPMMFGHTQPVSFILAAPAERRGLVLKLFSDTDIVDSFADSAIAAGSHLNHRPLTFPGPADPSVDVAIFARLGLAYRPTHGTFLV